MVTCFQRQINQVHAVLALTCDSPTRGSPRLRRAALRLRANGSYPQLTDLVGDKQLRSAPTETRSVGHTWCHPTSHSKDGSPWDKTTVDMRKEPREGIGKR